LKSSLSALPAARRPVVGLFLLFILGSLACALSNLTGPKPTAAPPTPMGDTLGFTVPVYSITLEPQESVPGTGLQYIGQEGDGHRVTIDGLVAIKRLGDSLPWSGVIAPGVVAQYSLRLSPTFGNSIIAAGPVQINVLNPEPVQLQTATNVTATYHFGGILLQYLVPKGSPVPGTTLVYEGLVEQGGQQMAQFSGTSGYPYLASIDSLVWTGQLRDNVEVRYSLRVVTMDEQSIRLGGTAELWVQAAS
jgi:hypothetical protein